MVAGGISLQSKTGKNMRYNTTELIEAWFSEHDGDGEFVCAGQAVPYWVIGPSPNVHRMIFTTKPRIVSAAIEQSVTSSAFGMVGRYGLPSETDVDWLSKMIGQLGVAFLGDMDPVDLMVFVWLRERLLSHRMTFLGISDAFLNTLAISSVTSLSMRSSSSEQSALAVLGDTFPDMRETIGTGCAAVLDQGNKIELESLVSNIDDIRIILSPASIPGF